jgi:maltose-binding protein MalE
VGITKNSVNKDLAANFVKYITLGSGSDAFVAGATLFPARRNALEQIEKDPSRDPVLKIAVYEVSHTAVPRARTPGYPEYSTVIDAMWEDIRNGANVKNSLDRAARDITSAMAKYR